MGEAHACLCSSGLNFGARFLQPHQPVLLCFLYLATRIGRTFMIYDTMFFNYLGQNFDCAECGRRHVVSLEDVVVDENWADRLCDLVAAHGGRKGVVLVAEARTLGVAGHEAAAVLTDAGIEVSVEVVADPAPSVSPVCDDATKDLLAGRIGDAGMLVAVGSGVINDLSKWIAFERDLPYVVVATAPSMNGYASDNIAPSIHGVKTLVHGRGPKAIISSPLILSESPREMIVSGLGDIVAKWVSSLDWEMNAFLFGEQICPRCRELLEAAEGAFLEHSGDLAAREPGAVCALFESLILTGIAMTMAGSSAPASGGEHLISHTLDMMSSIDGQPHDLHGRQVGVGTLVAAAVYEKVLALESPRFVMPGEAVDRQFWGIHADHVQAHFKDKQEKYAAAIDRLRAPGAWDELRDMLRPRLRRPDEIKDCLRQAGAAHSVADLGISSDRFQAALGHAHEMRARFTVLDLALIAGLWPVMTQDAMAWVA